LSTSAATWRFVRLEVFVHHQAVALGIPVLRHQDQRRGVGADHVEDEVQEDKRQGPSAGSSHDVQADPRAQEHRLHEDERPAPDDLRDRDSDGLTTRQVTPIDVVDVLDRVPRRSYGPAIVAVMARTRSRRPESRAARPRGER
jgi:hypothetical protein